MSRLIDKGSTAHRRASVAVLAAALGLMLWPGSALAGPDPLKGGSVDLKLQGSHGLKFKPQALTLPITSGAVDPVDGAGSVFVTGSFNAKRGKGKAKVKLLGFTLANGGQGSISARIGKDTIVNFATLSGGTLARHGWGATIANIRATIARRGAQALNRAFSPKKGKGARKSAAGGVKAGQPLGTITSITTDPLTVEVVPGSGELVLNTSALGTFVMKLSKHCIDPLPTGSPAGVSPIAPATTSGLGGTTYHFPVSGGTAAPDFSAGLLESAGGQALTKNSSLLNPGACGSAQPPVGTQLLSTDLGIAFTQNVLNSIPTLPTGPFPRAPLADIDFSTGSRVVDPVAKTLTITGATVTLNGIAAVTLNQIFPTESGNASDDFAAGNAIGTIDVTGVKLR